MGMRVLSLGPESYGGFAGIAQGTRDFLGGLASSPRVDGIDHVARLAPDGGPALPDWLDEGVASGSPVGFARRAAELARSGEHGLVFCLHVNLMPVAALLKLRYALPVWLAIHGIDAWSPPTSRLRRWSLAQADFVTSSSRFTRERFLEWAPLAPESVEVNHNPVHPEAWGLGPRPVELVRRHGLEERRVLLTLGRMLGGDRLKGHDRILDVLPRLLDLRPDTVWLVVGDGPDRARLEREAAHRGLAAHVRFAGRVPEEEKRAYYRVADAYALVSHTEGFGIAYVEAASCGLPCVGSLTDGSRDALADGALGALVDPENDGELVHALDRALGTPKRLRPELEHFHFANMSGRMVDMLERRFPAEVAA